MPTTVLIVDDHPSFRMAARLLLESDGWTVVGEAPDGASGLAAALELRPDVVLLDINLPDLSGLDVAGRLARENGPPVVLVSSRRAEEYGDDLERSGARGFVHKEDLTGDALRGLVA